MRRIALLLLTVCAVPLSAATLPPAPVFPTGNTSDSFYGTILLRTSKTSGHGIGSSIDEVIFTQTDQLMFLLDQLGMDFAAAGR